MDDERQFGRPSCRCSTARLFHRDTIRPRRPYTKTPVAAAHHLPFYLTQLACRGRTVTVAAPLRAFPPTTRLDPAPTGGALRFFFAHDIRCITPDGSGVGRLPQRWEPYRNFIEHYSWMTLPPFLPRGWTI